MAILSTLAVRGQWQKNFTMRRFTCFDGVSQHHARYFALVSLLAYRKAGLSMMREVLSRLVSAFPSYLGAGGLFHRHRYEPVYHSPTNVGLVIVRLTCKHSNS
jgi:hypothetical protein